MKTTIEINAMEDLVRSTVEIALAEALTRNSATVVQEIVRVALHEKAGKYEQETILQLSIRRAIQDEAARQINAWIDQNRDSIRVEVERQLIGMDLLKPEKIAENLTQYLSVTGARNAKPFKVKADLDEEE